MEPKSVSAAPNIKITVKTHTRLEEFMLDSEQLVKEVKPEIAERFDAEADNVCLIFAGRILKDNESLTSQNVKDGLTLHLVIRARNNASQPVNAPPSEARITPDANNLAARILSNPDYLRLIVSAEPNLAAFIEQNPEIGHVLNNPNVIREYLQMTRNPSTMQEYTRQEDLNLRNIENMPGGFAALQNMYTSLEDMFSTLDNPIGATNNPINNTTTTSNTNSTQAQMNSNPLPNPWSSSENGNNINPVITAELIEQMMSTPQIQELMQGLSQDPEFIQALISNYSPDNIDNPELASYLQNNFSTLLQNSVQGNSTNEPPETTYSEQLEQLDLMGFSNREANLNALVSSKGDINSAIDILTNSIL